VTATSALCPLCGTSEPDPQAHVAWHVAECHKLGGHCDWCGTRGAHHCSDKVYRTRTGAFTLGPRRRAHRAPAGAATQRRRRPGIVGAALAVAVTVVLIFAAGLALGGLSGRGSGPAAAAAQPAAVAAAPPAAAPAAAQPAAPAADAAPAAPPRPSAPDQAPAPAPIAASDAAPAAAPAPTVVPTSRPAHEQLASKHAPKHAPVGAPEHAPTGCDPNYGGCVPVAQDVDCAGSDGDGPAYVHGPVTVTGRDIYRLDANHDGIGCERTDAAAQPDALPKPTPKPARRPGPVAAPQPAPASGCDPNYGGCVPIGRDVDCAGGDGDGPAYVHGPIPVTGSDIYRLDADHDGIGCEATDAATQPGALPKPAPGSGRNGEDVQQAPSAASFDYRDLQVHGGDTATISFTVVNTGQRRGAEEPRLLLTDAPGGRCKRELGIERIELEPGTSRMVILTVDPRLLARFDGDTGRWHLAAGTYQIALAKAADSIVLTAQTTLPQAQYAN